MLLEVKVELLAEPELEQVVIKRLLADLHLLRSVFQGVADDLVVLIRDAVVKFAPEGDLLDNVLNSALLRSLLLRGSIRVWVVHNVARFLSCGYPVDLLRTGVVVGVFLLLFVFLLVPGYSRLLLLRVHRSWSLDARWNGLLGQWR